MTALPVPDPRRFGAANPFESPRDERAVLYIAAAVACAIHIVALFVPLPSRDTVAPPAPAVHRMPEIQPFVLEPPPLRDPRPPRAPSARLLPVPMELELDDDPLDDPEDTIIEDSDIVVKFEISSNDDVFPPPPPGIVDENTEGLVRPRALPGHAPPDYPRMSVTVRQEGRVVLSAVITEAGGVDSIEVLRAPQPELGMSRAAVEAVSRWEYTPGTLDGRPVAVRLTVIVDFELN